MRKLSNDGVKIHVEDRLGSLEACLEGTEGLVAVYLFGSYGTPDQTPLSDVDLAFVFRPDALPSADSELQLRARVLDALRQDDVSITVLNRAPSPLQYRVLATGRLIYCASPVELADFVELVLNRHADFLPHYEAFLREYDAALADRGGSGSPSKSRRPQR